MTRKILMCMEVRREFVDYLVERIPDLELCWDNSFSHMDTFHRALNMAGESPCVIMEDDVILTQGFNEKIESAISERPNDFIQFFSMRKADIETGSRYDKNYLMNQCFYLPAGYAKRIYDFSQNWDGYKIHKTGSDTMINAWLKSEGYSYWINVPSLVDHRIAKSQIDKRRSSKRQSKTFTDPWE